MSPAVRRPRRRSSPEFRALWRVRYLALVFAILQLSTIAAELFTSFSFKPEYDWITNTISELGVGHCTTEFDPRKGVEACSRLAGTMNGAMIFSGACLIALTVILRRSRGFSRLPGVLWVLAGAGSIATGFITLDSSPVLHQLVSMPLFFGGPLAIALGSFQFDGRVRLLGAMLGFSTLVLGVIFSTTDLAYGYGGAVERLVVWPSLGWVVFVAARARKEARREMSRRVPEPQEAARDEVAAGRE
ncbi:DUF998 domain-containing protein [Leucobacter sp. CSA1]|uniref:DUF998 domain-containing protein n=1 Tax=Leucobacter chromiisoli TaxID=2796471 RepID=A0A934UW65_9MICO|nr:DUF998 domain-containing protein [Leucobacter chromiisoli]MBK0419943.1 DUF998 domain-containing protein [Leucobacter chromiisoli]